MNESLILSVNKADLCDDQDVTLNPIETHPHCTIAYDVPPLSDSLRRKIEVMTTSKVGGVIASADGALVFPVRQQPLKVLASEDGKKYSYDFLVVKLKASDAFVGLRHLILTETKTKDPFEDREGGSQPHSTVCILKSGEGQKYLHPEHPFSRALEAFRHTPLTFDVLAWARDGDRTAPTIDIPLQ